MKVAPLFRAAGGVVLLAIALPAAASANTYCIAEAVCPAGGTVQTPNGQGIQEALTAAQSNAGSMVMIGPGTFTRPTGYSYTGPPVSIQGAGAQATKLTRAAESSTTVFGLNATEAVSPALEGVTIEVPAGNDMDGLGLTAGLAEHVVVTSAPSASVATGVALGSAGVFSNGTISIGEGTGVSGSGEVRGSRMKVRGFVAQASSGARFRGDRIAVEGSYGILSYFPETLVIEDTLIDLRDGVGARGVAVIGNGNGNAHATVRGVTLVNGGLGSKGVEVGANHGASSSVTVANTVVYGVEHPGYEAAAGAGSTTALSASYSSFDPTGDATVGEAGATKPAPPLLDHQLPTAVGFLSPLLGAGEGDWRLAPGSNLIDAGSSGALGAGEVATDLAGNPRIVNATRDVGAYEYQWQAPSVTGAADLSSVEIGKPVTFTGAGLTSEPGDAVASYQWSFDDGAGVAAGASAVHAFSQPGAHSATLTVTDLAGLAARTTLTVTATALNACRETAGKSAGCLERTVRNLKVTPRAFHAAAHGAAVAQRGGGKVTYDVGGGVSLVNFTLTRLASGVTKGTSCVKRRKHVRGRACTRVAKVTSFSRISPKGGNGFRLTGRSSGRRLAPGRYRLAAMPASGTAATGASAMFQILR